MPLLVQEGWLRHQSLEEPQTGWSVQHVSGMTTPPALALCAAQPPLLFKFQGGVFCLSHSLAEPPFPQTV